MKTLLKNQIMKIIALSGLLLLSANLCMGQLVHNDNMVIIGGNHDAELRVRQIAGKSHNNNTYDHLWLQNNTGKDIFVGNINKPSNMTIFGKFGARKVRVTTEGWADYVFKKDYDLPTLEEVEQHITEKGHLKDIPSAAQVEKEGIDLGKMNTKLLAKIEELTLYILQQQKEIQQQHEQIRQLQKGLEKLKNEN